MSKCETVVLTNMCMIYDDNGNILVQNRTKNTWPGITFPGGHVEKNESIVESTIREVKEETGLTISNIELCGICQWTKLCGYRYIVFCYKTKSFTGELLDSKEGHVFWIKKKDLFNYELANDLKEMFTVMDSATLSEFYSLRNDLEEEISQKLL